MDYRLPYYMAYPMPLQYDDERIEHYDFEYMKSMYPQTAKKVLPYVEDECDRMEYEGSMMYDEYPDQLQLRLMCRRVYDRMMREEKEELEMADEEDVEQQYLQMGRQQNGRNRRDRDQHLREIIEILLFQELFKRRSDHRNRGRRYY